VPTYSHMAGYRRNCGHDDGDLIPFLLTRLPRLAPSPFVPTHELPLVRILGREGGVVLITLDQIPVY